VLKELSWQEERQSCPGGSLSWDNFVISILLISATIIVYRQLQYIKNRDIGYNLTTLS